MIDDTQTGGLAVTLRSGSATDIGLRRKVNEDSLLVGHPVYVVADGMGGHDAGDLASQAVIARLSSLAGHPGLTPDDLANALDEAQSTVADLADEMANGAGTTVTGAIAVTRSGRPHWLVFNVGDSRVYRLRDAVLEQLTVDHSIAQELVARGVLAKEDVPTYAGRNVITKAVGANNSAADFWLYPIVAGESLILCSDGLTGEVPELEIASIVSSSVDPQQAADRLVAAALAGGGRDNVTVIVVEVVSGGINAVLDEATSVPAGSLDPANEATAEVRRP